MCTLAVALGVFEDTPLLVAANRDEALDRPASGPRAWTGGAVPFFAPVDDKAAGSWLGISARHLFAGITNRFGSTAPFPGRRSRGLLLVDVLQARSVEEAADIAIAHGAQRYNRYHLLVADSHGACLVVSDGEKLQQRQLDSGIHVITERSCGAGDDVRSGLVESHLRKLGPRVPGPEDLSEVLSIHAGDPFEGTCVHAPVLNYGTRSSTIMRLGSQPGDFSFMHAEGPPCETSYKDFSALASAALGW